MYTRRSLKLWDILKVSLAILLLGYVVSKTNFGQLLKLQERFSWGWFWITFVLFGAMIVVKALQYYYLIERRLPYLRVLEIVVLQNAIMNFVATAAGIASYITILGLDKNVKFGRATASFVIVKIGDLIAVLLLFLVSIFIIKPMPVVALRIGLAISALVCLILVFILLIVLFRQNFALAVRKMVLWMKLDQLNVVQSGLSYLDVMAGYDQKKFFRMVFTAVVLSLIYIGITMIWGYTRLRMFSLTIGIEIVIFVFSLLQLASWVPVYVLGGLGISETLSIFLFGLFGENEVELAAVLIGVRLVMYLLSAFSLFYLPITTFLNSIQLSRNKH